MKLIFLSALVFLTNCKEQTLHPVQGEIVEAVYGLGTVESEEVYNARSGLQVTVREFYVTEGQDVKKGQALFQVDQGITYTAPFDGRVTEIAVHVRENVSPQSLILTILNVKKLYLSVALEQHAAMRIKKGLKTEISFEFFRNQKFEGIIDTFYPQKNEFIAKVTFTKIPDGILPGMTADVAFEIDRKKNAILIPSKTVQNGHVTLLQKGKKNRVPVEIGLRDLENTEILSPQLSTEDEILVP
jgi:macrolide-specific efflux system membrane fusion protein